MKKTLLSWSSGKDSSWTLYKLQQDPGVELLGLFTTINEEANRVAMHAVRRQLLELQAERAGLPLHLIPIPQPCSNEQYEAAMRRFLDTAMAKGATHMAFGDLFLEDIREYREKNLVDSGFAPLFPIWGEDTHALARRMLAAGLRARVTCVDPKQLSRDFAGREFDQAFVDELPTGVDPCGENGEFHTFAYAGPMFDRPIAIDVGETVERDGFVFTDLTTAE